MQHFLLVLTRYYLDKLQLCDMRAAEQEQRIWTAHTQ